MSIYKEKHRQNTVSNNSIALLRLPQVIAITGLTKQKIYELIREDLFPKQVRITDRSVAWVKTEVEDWVNNLIAQRDGGRHE